MADATVDNVWYDDANINLEFAELTVTDGETYQSRKFNTVLLAFATAQADVDADINCTVSGGTVTINWALQTDQKLALMLYGVA